MTKSRSASSAKMRGKLVREAGEGIERSAIRRLLRLTPAERAQLAVKEARALADFDAKTRR
jgi:hypothetical protein